MKKIRISLDLTPDMKSFLEKVAEENGVTQGEAIRRGLALFKAIKDGERDGEQAALMKNGKVTARLVGF